MQQSRGDLNVFKGIEEGAVREETAALGKAGVKSEIKHSGNGRVRDLGRQLRASPWRRGIRSFNS